MPKSVHLYPVPGVSLYPWPAVECDVTPAEWAELQAYSPCPFSTAPPGEAPAEQPTGPSEQDGPPDSEA